MYAAQMITWSAKQAFKRKEALPLIGANLHHTENRFSLETIVLDRNETKHTCQNLLIGSIFEKGLQTRFEWLRVRNGLVERNGSVERNGLLERNGLVALLPRNTQPLSGARGFASAATPTSEDPVEEFNKEMSAVFGEPAARDQFSQTSGAALSSRPDRAEKFTTSDSHTEYSSSRLTHVDSSGRASMVDVSRKEDSTRVAVASAQVSLGGAAFSLVKENKISKGDVLTVAQIAGINAAKQTANLIPLCHNLLLSKVKVELKLDDETQSVRVKAEVKTKGPTGVEMEALTAASVASLTVYDMCKAVSKSIVISNVLLESKSGGKSGDWSRPHD